MYLKEFHYQDSLLDLGNKEWQIETFSTIDKCFTCSGNLGKWDLTATNSSFAT